MVNVNAAPATARQSSGKRLWVGCGSMKWSTTQPLRVRNQFFRYAIIGVLLNASLYAAYLLLTHTVMTSRAAMSVTYVAGVLIGFALNRKITFCFRGDQIGALSRYVVSYGIGYVITWVGLWASVTKSFRAS